jgi:hypothetical protein
MIERAIELARVAWLTQARLQRGCGERRECFGRSSTVTPLNRLYFAAHMRLSDTYLLGKL